MFISPTSERSECEGLCKQCRPGGIRVGLLWGAQQCIPTRLGAGVPRSGALPPGPLDPLVCTSWPGLSGALRELSLLCQVHRLPLADPDCGLKEPFSVVLWSLQGWALLQASRCSGCQGYGEQGTSSLLHVLPAGWHGLFSLPWGLPSATSFLVGPSSLGRGGLSLPPPGFYRRPCWVASLQALPKFAVCTFSSSPGPGEWKALG